MKAEWFNGLMVGCENSCFMLQVPGSMFQGNTYLALPCNLQPATCNTFLRPGSFILLTPVTATQYPLPGNYFTSCISTSFL